VQVLGALTLQQRGQSSPAKFRMREVVAGPRPGACFFVHSHNIRDSPEIATDLVIVIHQIEHEREVVRRAGETTEGLHAIFRHEVLNAGLPLRQMVAITATDSVK